MGRKGPKDRNEILGMKIPKKGETSFEWKDLAEQRRPREGEKITKTDKNRLRLRKVLIWKTKKRPVWWRNMGFPN